MMCARHRSGATYVIYGRPFCDHCFDEAVAVAEAKALEAKVRDLRYHSADALMRRLARR